jgi:hypothetical protein
MTTDTINRKTFEPPHKAEVNRKERLVTGYISTIDVDMDGDAVLPMGMDDESYFKNTRSVNLNHDHTLAVGTNVNLARKARGVYAVTYITRTALGEDMMTMLEDGVVRGFSIEWDPKTLIAGPPTKAEHEIYGTNCKRLFRSWMLTAYAFTPIPCNPNCYVDGIKDARYVMAQQEGWDRMEAMFKAGKIHRSSAVAAGFPDAAERETFPVAATETAKQSVIFAGGLTWKRK